MVDYVQVCLVEPFNDVIWWRVRLGLLRSVVGVRPDEDEDREHGEERLHADEGGGHVVVDLGLDRARVVVLLGVLPLREVAISIFGVDHDGVFGGGDVHGELDRDGAGAVATGGRGGLLEDLEQFGGLPALLVLLEVVGVLAPRAPLDLLCGVAELDVDRLADGETGVGDVDAAGAGGVLGLGRAGNEAKEGKSAPMPYERRGARRTRTMRRGRTRARRVTTDAPAKRQT